MVLVDAEAASADPPPSDATFVEQLAAADLVVLNKRDLVDDDALQRARDLVVALSDDQPVLVAEHARVDPGLLFPPDPEGARIGRRDPDAEGHDHEHQHDRFTTTELSFEGITDPDVVLARVAEEGALRAKGFVRTADGIAVVQGVGSRIALTRADRPIPDHLIGTVVIIHRAPEAP